MRVGLIVPFREPGGVSRLASGLVDRAPQIGHDVTILVPHEAVDARGQVAPVSPLPRPRVGEVLRYGQHYLPRQRRLSDVIRSSGIEVVVCFGLNVIDVLPSLVAARVPLVLSLNSDRRLLGNLPIRVAARSAGAVMTEGPGVARRLLGDRARSAIPFLPPVDVPANGPPFERRANLGMLSGLTPQKDHLLALESLALARSYGWDCTLRIAGSATGSSYECSVRSRIDELGLARCVELTGFVPASSFLAQVDALLVTSRFEGVATSTIEGLAACRPFVSVPVGSLPDLAGDSGGGVVCSDAPRRARLAPELARAMIDLGTDVGRLRAMGVSGREYVAEHCTWERYLEGFDRAVRRAANRRRQ